MKQILIGLIAMFLVLSVFSVSVMAEEETADTSSEDVSEIANEDLSDVPEGTLISTNTETQTVDEETAVEINDDLSEDVSSTDVLKAKIGILLTLNQEKKAAKELKLAKLQLIRAKIAAKNGNEIAMTKALEAHNRILEKIQERIDSLDGKSTEQGIKNTAEKLVGLERAVEVHEAKIARLKEILISQNITEEQIAKVQEKISKVEEIAAKLKEAGEAKKEQVKTRLMAVAEVTEEQANTEIKKIEKSKNLDAVKAKVAEVKTIRGEKAAEVLLTVIAKLEAKQTESGKDLSTAISKLIAVRDKINAKLEAGKTEAKTPETEEE